MVSLKKAAAAIAVSALVLSACSDDSTAPGLTKAATLTVVGKTTIEAPPNQPSADPVQVKLSDANGVGLPFRLVTFTVDNGGTLTSDSVLTDGAGVATTIAIAAAAGTYTVTAASEGVAPVTVTLTASTYTKVVLTEAGNGQSGLAGEPLNPFSVIVLNNAGERVAGATVTFAVTSGGGSLTTTTATTNSQGIASTTLTLGSSGPQIVTATVPSLPVGSNTATFNVTIADPCSAARQATVPGSFTRTLDVLDCHNSANRYVEYFNTTVTATPLQFTETSTAFVPSFSIRKVGGVDTIGFHTPAAGNATFKAFLAPGSYWLAPSSSAANAVGDYTLTSTAIAGTDVTACERVYITRGASSGSQTIAATDCQFNYNDGNGAGSQLHYGDRYRIYLKAGETITITQSGTADHLIRVINANTGVVALQYDNGVKGTTETTPFTATATGQWIIDCATYNNAAGGVPPDVGGYVLTIAP